MTCRTFFFPSEDWMAHVLSRMRPHNAKELQAMHGAQPMGRLLDICRVATVSMGCEVCGLPAVLALGWLNEGVAHTGFVTTDGWESTSGLAVLRAGRKRFFPALEIAGARKALAYCIDGHALTMHFLGFFGMRPANRLTIGGAGFTIYESNSMGV